ncbi:MFS transporter [Pseudorhizobium flavum]|uniref:Putative MFS family arabinose efflux permease n=1 Tax=Pseudorhizobium flavum TaxID=1335061 RepID=A0A7W9Z3K7_9HYPH|nr:MFS transporter [Pseudorhizobium flavum]MBB6181916.1 putative MFS family arabinose efflux permease [Pseudorhizobium flavum]CAD6628816.1 MFS transporter [Pseudorhizobium flavum]
MSERRVKGILSSDKWKTNDTNVLIMMTFAHTCAAAAMFMLAALGPTLEAELGLHASTIGYLMGLAWACGSVASILIGVVIVRYGPTVVLQFGLLFLAMGALTLAISRGVTFLALSMAIIGGGYGIVGPSSSVILAQFCRPERRNFTFSIKQTATPGGTAVMGVVAPYVTATASWPWTGIVVAMVSALLAVVVFGFKTQWNHIVPDPGSSHFGGLRLIFANSRLRRLAIMCFLFACAQVGMTAYLALGLASLAEFSPAAAGTALSLSSAAAIAGRFMVGYLADRARTTEHVLLGTGLANAGAICTLALVSPAWPTISIYLLVIIFGVAGHSWAGLYQAAVVTAGPLNRASELVSGSFAFMFLGGVAGPLFSGLVFALTHSYMITLFFLGGIALTGALIIAMTIAGVNSEEN